MTTKPPGVTPAPTGGQAVALDATGQLPVRVAARRIPVLTADPVAPLVGQIWFRSDNGKLCVRADASTTKTVTLT